MKKNGPLKTSKRGKVKTEKDGPVPSGMPTPSQMATRRSYFAFVNSVKTFTLFQSQIVGGHRVIR